MSVTTSLRDRAYARKVSFEVKYLIPGILVTYLIDDPIRNVVLVELDERVHKPLGVG